jgi:hypothetical protein
MYQPPQKPNRSNADLMKYAGLGMQLLVSLGLAVYAGYKADKWLNVHFPILVWVLPLIVLFLLIYKLIRETSKKKNDAQ